MPWDEELLNLSNVRMDFIIKMEAIEHGVKLKNEDLSSGNHKSQVKAAWTYKLRDRAESEFSRSPEAYLLKYYKFLFKG